MPIVYLGLGSNKGDRKGFLQQALHQIEHEIGEILSRSHYYRTEAWNGVSTVQESGEQMESQMEFINQVIKIETSLTPDALLQVCLKIEEQLGRVRKQKNEAREIDIDILFFDQQIIAQSDLNIPHPLLHKRKFVLVPLAEIAPEFVHPQQKKPVKELLISCIDRLKVELLL